MTPDEEVQKVLTAISQMRARHAAFAVAADQLRHEQFHEAVTARWDGEGNLKGLEIAPNALRDYTHTELEDIIGAEDFAGHHARVRKDLDLRLQLALRVRKQASPRARGDERNTVAGAAAEPSCLIWIERCIAAAELESLTDDAHDLFRRLEGELLRRCPERRLRGETYGHENGAVASDSNNCFFSLTYCVIVL